MIFLQPGVTKSGTRYVDGRGIVYQFSYAGSTTRFYFNRVGEDGNTLEVRNWFTELGMYGRDDYTRNKERDLVRLYKPIKVILPLP